MTTTDLAKSYLTKAKKRLRALEVLFAEDDYSDVNGEIYSIGLWRRVSVWKPAISSCGCYLSSALGPNVAGTGISRSLR